LPPCTQTGLDRQQAWWRGVCLCLVGALVCGCASAGFYLQAVAGQLEIWRREVPIDRLLADPALDANTRAKLELVAAALAYAQTELALPAGGSYRSYADLGRDYVIWNVFAAPEFALHPHQSCFVIAGCLDYRGYFRREHAERYAAQLRAQGFDVFVGGVAAYSTLGWFEDPVLNTFLGWSEVDLLEILFHEMAHQRLYVPDDTTFNESYATAVAEAGLERWYLDRDGSAAAVRAGQQRKRAVLALLDDTRTALSALYAEALPDEHKRQTKQTIFVELTARYARLRAGWDDNARTDRIMAAEWNNARLAAFATYHDFVQPFRALLKACGDDFAAFHSAASNIAALDKDARHSRLRGFEIPGQAIPCDAAAGNETLATDPDG